jgi:hypothetical protein
MAAYGVGGEPNEVHELYGPMGWDNGKISGGMGTRFKVEDGFKIRLWHELWCRDEAL